VYFEIQEMVEQKKKKKEELLTFVSLGKLVSK
jgi:hypothetical protein